MLVFVPIAMALEHVSGVSAPVKFLVAALAIIPIARLIGASTEHLSHYTGDSIGGLLNAMFGNLPELIICVVALKAGLYPMVAASLIGAILFNLLLVLGLCFLLGGLRYHTIDFNAGASGCLQLDDVHRGDEPGSPKHLRAGLRTERSHSRAGEHQYRARGVPAGALRILPALHDRHPSGGVREHRQRDKRRSTKQRGVCRYASASWSAALCSPHS